MSEIIVAEIANPSDPYTVKGERDVLCCVGLMLGRGQYPLNDENGETILPFFWSGGDAAQFFLDKFGVALDKFLDDEDYRVADCLDTVLIGSFGDRKDVEAALELMDPADQVGWLDKRHDRKRSSMNDIGAYAWSMATAIRNKIEGG